MGLIVDAFGLWVDRRVLEKWKWLGRKLEYNPKPPPPGFYAIVSEHTLLFWKDQWAYYSCYRNVLALAVPGLPSAIVTAFRYWGWIWAVAIAAIRVLMAWTLIEAIKILQGICGRIAQEVGESPV